jgi:hypothetical protein
MLRRCSKEARPKGQKILMLIQSSNAPVIGRVAHAFLDSSAEQRQMYSVSVNDSFATVTFFGARISDLSQLCPGPPFLLGHLFVLGAILWGHPATRPDGFNW